mmetsp:Transcript_112232/g.281237  ORF Transcript_112232/g.281237 Transcript_112232/m.281237 type:complete len:152 (+) Transcript_112232:68-523(+)
MVMQPVRRGPRRPSSVAAVALGSASLALAVAVALTACGEWRAGEAFLAAPADLPQASGLAASTPALMASLLGPSAALAVESGFEDYNRAKLFVATTPPPPEVPADAGGGGGGGGQMAFVFVFAVAALGVPAVIGFFGGENAKREEERRRGL